MNAKFSTEGVYVPDALIGGNAELLTAQVVIVKSGQTLARGAVIGRDSAGKVLLSASAAVDGSEVPYAVLAEPVDAASGDKSALAYLRGDFNLAALTIGAGHTADSVTEALRTKDITILPA